MTDLNRASGFATGLPMNGAGQAVSAVPVGIPDAGSDEGFYDDAGRWWPSNAEWCDRCQGMGTEDCDCGGDFCVCGAYDNLTCRRCDGEGYWIPTPADIAAREENARWWRELHESIRDSDRSGEAGETRSGSTIGESAGRKASPESKDIHP